jgi:hypothetical protein
MIGRRRLPLIGLVGLPAPAQTGGGWPADVSSAGGHFVEASLSRVIGVKGVGKKYSGANAN